MTTKTNLSPEAQKILSLIENVDPNDTDMLDEIDARVDSYLAQYTFLKMYHEERYMAERSDGTIGHYTPLRYTRSLDALKQIRPDGWCNGWHVNPQGTQTDVEKYYCNRFSMNAVEFDFIGYRNCETYELTELHAIIQAIDYNRGIK